MKDYWEEITDGTQLYQMGAQSHRVYLLDLLQKRKALTLLDVGCGTGPIYQLIKDTWETWKEDTKKRWEFVYKGVDPAPAMIKACKHNFPDGQWEIQNATDLKEKDNSWDCVLLMHSLDYVYDYEKAILEAARVAKKYVLIVLWRGINYNPAADNHLNNPNQKKGKIDYKLATLQEFSWGPLQVAFQKAGLTLIEKNDGPEVNKEGRTNTLILLKK